MTSPSHDAVLRESAGTNVRHAVARILAAYDAASKSEMVEGLAWYPQAQQAAVSLADRFGGVEYAAAVIAQLSPRTMWGRNLMGATDMANGIVPAYCIGANVQRAKLALESDEPLETINGPKTSRFARNIMGDESVVTVDVWAARLALHGTRTNWRGENNTDAEKILGRKGVYEAIEHAYKIAAQKRGVTPAQMQAITWVVSRNGRSN